MDAVVLPGAPGGPPILSMHIHFNEKYLMKPSSHLERDTRRFAGAVTAAGCSLLMAAPFLAATENENDGFLQKVQDWQNDMSAKFGNTWKELRKEGLPSLVSASVDLREQEKSYMLRLDLPGRDLDKVQVSLNGDVLGIAAPESGNLGRYEQSVVLGAVQAGAEPVIERKKEDGVITVTVPREAADLRPFRYGILRPRRRCWRLPNGKAMSSGKWTTSSGRWTRSSRAPSERSPAPRSY